MSEDTKTTEAQKEKDAIRKKLIRRAVKRKKRDTYKNTFDQTDGHVEVTQINLTNKYKDRKKASVDVTDYRNKGGRLNHDPKLAVANSITDALDPVKAPTKGRSLADMSEEEKEALAAQYGAPLAKRYTVHLQRPARLTEDDEKQTWYLLDPRRVHSRQTSRQKPFIRLVTKGEPLPTAQQPLDVILELTEGRYILGVTHRKDIEKEEIFINDETRSEKILLP